MNGNLYEAYSRVRSTTESLCKPLKTEDYVVQPIEDVSPPKWHLGHTSWFFEVFILENYKNAFNTYNPDYHYLFNSYYESKGEKILRSNRGNLSRPTVEEVYEYRRYIDKEMKELIENGLSEELEFLLTLGLNHEQQHQELLMTDIKYILGNNPLFPSYIPEDFPGTENPVELSENYLQMEEGIYEIGWGGSGFSYDNEHGRHKVYLHPYRIMDRLVTNGEFMEFIESGAYENFHFWLSDGWDWINQNNIKAPLHWHKIDGIWHQYTLHGFEKINENEPVTHVSYYEAEAFARWRGKRLPTEEEWEAAAKKYETPGEYTNFLDNENYRPVQRTGTAVQFYGDVWEWTGSAYMPYPYYKQDKGALGEYNGKFMSGQMVLRGGSCATPRDHIRYSCRNFFQPEKRWQFTGLRLAEHV